MSHVAQIYMLFLCVRDKNEVGSAKSNNNNKQQKCHVEIRPYQDKLQSHNMLDVVVVSFLLLFCLVLCSFLYG